MKMSKKIFFVSILIIFILSASLLSFAKDLPKIIFFHSLKCKSCALIKSEFIPAIEEKYKDKIEIEYRDVDKIDDYKLLLSYQQKYKDLQKNLPLVFVEGRFLSGKEQVEKHLQGYIDYVLRKGSFKPRELLPSIDLISRFRSFSPLAVILAGLIDGINPCAFTVIVFFVTFLTFQKYRKKEILVTGISFILAVFLAYLLLGVGLFNFLYNLVVFPYVIKIIYGVTAFLCLSLAVFSLYDILRFRRSGNKDEMVLRLPDRIKYHIQRIIGLHYRKQQNKEENKKGLAGLILAALIVGFSISILEAVCTGQVYLPTIAFVLKTSSLKMQALVYLVLYNLMFIVPLFLVFLFALLGVSSEQFSHFMQRHIVMVKILMTTIFLILGSALIAGLLD